MRKNIITTIPFLLCGVAAAQPAAVAGPVEELERKVQQLSVEIRTMKLDLYRLALRQIASECAPLQREMQTVETRLARIQSLQRTAQERDADSQRRWNEEMLSSEERREMREFEEAGAGPVRLSAEREKLTRRQGEIAQQLQTQSNAWVGLSAAITSLETELRQNSRAPATASR